MRLDWIGCSILAVGMLATGAILRAGPTNQTSPAEIRATRIVVVDNEGRERFVIDPSNLSALDVNGRPLLEWRGYRAAIHSPFENSAIELTFGAAPGTSGIYSPNASRPPGSARLTWFNHVARELMQVEQGGQYLTAQFTQYSWPPTFRAKGGEVREGLQDWTQMSRVGWLGLKIDQGRLGWNEWVSGREIRDVIRDASNTPSN